ncbi:Gfo/Idh/MocA family oxidoreductase [Solitalea agri]|nr:Gfo/Idh/MocA family oxidoreductase [Solitalea agri]
MNSNVLIVGAGAMAIEYFNILKSLDINVFVIGRSKDSAVKFEQATSYKPFVGGINEYIKLHNKPAFSKAIIATGTEALKDTVRMLVDWGIKNLLVEKPGALSFEQLYELNEYCHNKDCAIYIAYNRRFYESVDKANEIIKLDGGVSSFNFEFTEWSHKIEPLTKAEGVKENWFFANSTHVVDLAFYLGGGLPVRMSPFVSGQLNWHSVAIFAGAGLTSNNALFTYQANWKAPGRWGIEILTLKHKLYLRPLEELKIQKLGSIEIEDVPIDNCHLEQKFKPGLFKQTSEFINDHVSNLVTLKQHTQNSKIYEKILKGETLK